MTMVVKRSTGDEQTLKMFVDAEQVVLRTAAHRPNHSAVLLPTSINESVI